MLGDRMATKIPTHITLVPPVWIENEDMDEVRSFLADAAAEFAPFTVHLRGTGTFRPVSPVVFVVLARGISGCERVALRLRRGPLAAELSFPYHPHVTVAHDLPDDLLDRAFDELANYECTFKVSDFHLYVHDVEDGWQPTDTFELSAEAERGRDE